MVVVCIDMYVGYRMLISSHNQAEISHDNEKSISDNVKHIESHSSTKTDSQPSNQAAKPNNNLHNPHELLGWTVNSNASSKHFVPGNFDVIYTTNNQGYRTTPAKPDAKHDIYIFGDSFTFGHGVTDLETFSSVLSSTWLNENYRVINAGVNGYGITQMYGRFLEIADHLKQGDIVLFTPISKDLLRSFKDFAAPAHYLFTNEEMKSYPYFDDKNKIKLGKLNTTANWIKGLLFHAPLTGNIFRKIHRYRIGEIDFIDAQKMFSSVKEIAIKKNASFYLYFLPQDKDLARGRYKYDISRYDHVNIWDYFPQGPRAKRIIGFTDDGHWNCLGHEIAAYAIAKTLFEFNAISNPPNKHKFKADSNYHEELVNKADCKQATLSAVNQAL
jgi:hypothetical protein